MEMGKELVGAAQRRDTCFDHCQVTRIRVPSVSQWRAAASPVRDRSDGNFEVVCSSAWKNESTAANRSPGKPNTLVSIVVDTGTTRCQAPSIQAQMCRPS